MTNGSESCGLSADKGFTLDIMRGTPKDLFASPKRQAVLQRAIDVFGNEMKAKWWFLKQVPALGYHTPYSFLDKPETKQEILDVLTRIEDGALY